MTRQIRTILIANRGEIACRIMRTARAMGIRTVAVFSEADAHSAHVAAADTAICIGPAPARESYLKIEAILEAARATGADAIHPGYGFLSENASFADAVAAAGLIFIGPPASAIRAMGSKSAAKALMAAANVPIVPGYHGEDQSPDYLLGEAEKIGFPVLIKASAGGGGKGMKIVEAREEFADALASAKREAANAFGDDRMLIEKYLTKPRHIEVQVFADSFGETVYLFERDCSIQRRHQKVIEEAPAPGISPERRAAMGKAAVDAAKAVGYVGAGTVEFIAEGEHFYFMEMNTRLQVEHPVTEAITGQDLVEWQIRVARGECLPLSQSQLSIHGHAMEVRLYAEDPKRDFLPQTGRLSHLVLPEGRPGVRIDAGVRQGDAVTVHYDPMIAKIIAHGADRTEALTRLDAALAATEVVGLASNRVFLRAIIEHPAFAAADLDTGFIPRHHDALFPPLARASAELLAIAAASVLADAGQHMTAEAARTTDPYSPWATLGGWQLNQPAETKLAFLDGEEEVSVSVRFEPTGLAVAIGGVPHSVSIEPGRDGRLIARVDDRRLDARVVRDGAHLILFADGAEHRLELVDPHASPGGASIHAGHLAAPMPGRLIEVRVAVGEAVVKGQALVVLEAMKMEHVIVAPGDGVVGAVHYAAGDLVAEGAELLVIGEGEA
jgi:3-methylcrotonyl-CoA carboxylase alpha subunit